MVARGRTDNDSGGSVFSFFVTSYYILYHIFDKNFIVSVLLFIEM